MTEEETLRDQIRSRFEELMESETIDSIALGLIMTGAEIFGWEIASKRTENESDEVSYLILGTPTEVDRITECIEVVEKVQ